MDRKHLYEMSVELEKSLRAFGLIVMINLMTSSIRFTQNAEGWCLETGWKMLYSITVILRYTSELSNTDTVI